MFYHLHIVKSFDVKIEIDHHTFSANSCPFVPSLFRKGAKIILKLLNIKGNLRWLVGSRTFTVMAFSKPIKSGQTR